MPIDLMIAFGILIALCVYLIYSRQRYEQKIVNVYEEKYEEWKKNAETTSTPKECKELVGLVFKEGSKVNLELFEDKYYDRIKRGKIDIKVKS